MGNVKDNISKNLSYFMELNGLNNKELSRLLGVNESTVGKWLLKKATPRMGVVEKLAALFDVNKSDILEDKSEERDMSDLTPVILAREMKGLSEGQIEIIRAMINEFKNSGEWDEQTLSKNTRI